MKRNLFQNSHSVNKYSNYKIIKSCAPKEELKTEQHREKFEVTICNNTCQQQTIFKSSEPPQFNSSSTMQARASIFFPSCVINFTESSPSQRPIILLTSLSLFSRNKENYQLGDTFKVIWKMQYITSLLSQAMH